MKHRSWGSRVGEIGTSGEFSGMGLEGVVGFI